MQRSAAAGTLLLAALLLAGCPATEPGTAEKETPWTGKPDPAVAAQLAKRPDLARNRVWILGLDGCDPGLVRDLAAAGRLPNFQRLMKEGAFGPLRSQEPMLSPLLWTSIATGKYPTEHGVLDFLVRSRTDPKVQETVTSRHRQVEAIWDIVGRYGRTVGHVGWLASHPADKVNGFAVSERTELLAYLYNEGITTATEGKTWPPELLGTLASLRREPSQVTWEETKPFLHVTEELWKAACREEKFTDDNRTNNMRLILTGADNFRREDLHLWRERKPALFCTYFEMLDAVSHYFMAYRDPITWKPRDLEGVKEALKGPQAPDPVLLETAWKFFRGEGALGEAESLGSDRLATIKELTLGAAPEKVERWKDAVDAAYEWTDRMLGEAMAACDADTTLLVVSDHGFARGPGKPPFDSTFRSRQGGASYHMPNGVFGAWGRGVRKGFEVPEYDREAKAPTGIRLIDLAPTVLALMGFPKADDMPGRIATEVFDLDLATGSVPTFESGRATRLAKERVAEESRKPAGGAGTEAVERKDMDDAMKRLSAVGYVGSAEEGPVRAMMFMAASYFEQERWAEAEEAYAEAAKTAQGQQKTQCLAQSGCCRYKRNDMAGARAAVQQALALDPAFPLALLALAQIESEEGNRDAQVAAWERLVAAVPKNPAWKLYLADALRLRSESVEGGAPADLERAVALVHEGFTQPADAPPPGAKPEDDPVSAAGHNLGGLILLRKGEFREAFEHLQKAVTMEPNFVKPRTNLGVLHLNLAAQSKTDEMRATNRAEALRWFGQALELQPDNAKALYNRAELNFHIAPRDLAAAEKDLRAVLAKDPKYRRAAALLDKVTAEREPPR